MNKFNYNTNFKKADIQQENYDFNKNIEKFRKEKNHYQYFNKDNQKSRNYFEFDDNKFSQTDNYQSNNKFKEINFNLEHRGGGIREINAQDFKKAKENFIKDKERYF